MSPRWRRHGEVSSLARDRELRYEAEQRHRSSMFDLLIERGRLRRAARLRARRIRFMAVVLALLTLGATAASSYVLPKGESTAGTEVPRGK